MYSAISISAMRNMHIWAEYIFKNLIKSTRNSWTLNCPSHSHQPKSRIIFQKKRDQRSYQRWLDKRIYKTEMKFWAVLGSRGCREKTLPTAISMQLFGVVFWTFLGQKKGWFFLKYCSVCTEKLHNIKLRNIFKNS